MSFNFEFPSHEAAEALTVKDGHGQDVWHPLVDGMVALTMAVECPCDDEHFDQFCERIALWQKIYGPMMRDGHGAEFAITKEHAEKFRNWTHNVCFISDLRFQYKMMLGALTKASGKFGPSLDELIQGVLDEGEWEVSGRLGDRTQSQFPWSVELYDSGQGGSFVLSASSFHKDRR